jgi:hypothetical protein
MGTIALKQLCALAYHYVSMNTIDTLASQQRFTFVSWVVIAVVMATTSALIASFFGLFSFFKIQEKNADLLLTVAAEQKAWRMDEEMELSAKDKVIACVKRVLSAAWADVKRKMCCGGGGGGAQNDEIEDGGGDDTVVQVEGGSAAAKAAAVKFTTESVAKHERELREIVEQIKVRTKENEAAEERMEAMIAKHNEVIALRLIEGVEIDGDDILVMARKPLNVFEAAEAKLCPCCCRNKRTSSIHIPTDVLTRGSATQPLELSDANVLLRTPNVTFNPACGAGIAMQALARAAHASESEVTGDGSGGGAAAARSDRGVRSAATKVNAPPRDASVAVEDGGGDGAAVARSGGGRSDALGLTRFVSLVRESGGGGGAAAARGGGEQRDTMHVNQMARGSPGGGAAAAASGGGEECVETLDDDSQSSCGTAATRSVEDLGVIAL